MADETLTPPSARAEARAAAKVRRLKQIERREACFSLFASGYTPHEIARELKVSAATVRRMIDQAIDDRRLDAPDRYARVQVARLSKMLSALDSKLERGDTSTVGPLLKLFAALDRYHGMNMQYSRLGPPAVERPAVPVLAPAVPLALTHAPAAPIAAPSGRPAEVADFGA